MGFLSGLKKFGKKIGKGFKKVGKGIHKGISFGKKILGKAKSIPLLGDAIKTAEKFTPLGAIEAGVDAVDDVTQGNFDGAIANAGRAGIPGVAQAESAVRAGRSFARGDIRGGIDNSAQAIA
jgi:hypothetical protein